MPTNNSSQADCKQDTKSTTTTESKPESVETATANENGAPLIEQQQSIMNLFRNALNPNGENPQIDEYLTSTFSYIQNVFNKMETSENKDATAQEIADDLTDRFDKWVKKRENKKTESGKEDTTERNEESDRQDESKEPLKIEEVD